jgi:diguanylate cyclase (GGDEF)-like protein
MDSCLREGDTLARIGGDEFVILLGDLPDDTSYESTLQRIQQVLRPPFHLAGQALEIGACIGVTIYPDDSANADDLLLHADTAMYSAKHTGGNGICRYHPDMISPD